jgi:hypothetical protein
MSASASIESVLSLMISSLKEMHPSHEALLLASKDFLRIFTDAIDHVPHHHRTRSVFASLYFTLHIGLSYRVRFSYISPTDQVVKT